MGHGRGSHALLQQFNPHVPQRKCCEPETAEEETTWPGPV